MPLLLLHPIGVDHASWQFVSLSDATAPDLPGHGDREFAGSFDLDAVADELKASLTEPVDVVGVSLGGVVAQHLALRADGLVRSLVLACTTAAGDRKVLEKRAMASEALPLALVAEELVSRWFPNHRDRSRDCSERIAFVRDSLQSADARAMAAAWRAVAAHDVIDRLGCIDVPVTVVAGVRDAPAPHERIGPFARQLPCMRAAILDSGHLPQVEVPESFELLVKDHIAWVDDLVGP